MAEKQRPHFFWISPRPLFATGFLLLFSLFVATSAIGATLYKNYVVRQDRGLDILCDPYEIQPGDWVFKIFRQKGEIAHTDFRDFLGIFHRLNPHIADINLLRPGQLVDIPIKKMKQGQLPGQDSGVVTIPFVMVEDSTALVKKYTKEYTVQRGDTLSQLIANHFGGRFGDSTFRKGLSLFKAANPRVTDANAITAGERVHLPDPSIREQEWYGKLFDAEGNLVEKIAGGPSPDSSAAVNLPPRTPSSTSPEKTTPAAEAADLVGGRLMDKGTHYISREQQGDVFELDLSRYPMIDIEPSPQVILSTEDQVMGVDIEAVRAYGENVKVARISNGASAQEIVQAILSVLEENTDEQGIATPLTLTENGLHIQVSAKWMHRKVSDNGQKTQYTCITPVSTAAQRTDPEIVRHLAAYDIEIRDILTNADEIEIGTPSYPSVSDAFPGQIEQIDGSDQKALVEAVSKLMGFTYTPSINVNFTYTGISVQALSNKITFDNGKETLIDFGDLYGDAIQAIQTTGMPIIQIPPDDRPVSIVQKLFDSAGMNPSAQPVFYAADRPADFNTALMIPGVLVSVGPGSPLLFTETAFPGPVTALIQRQGIRIIHIRVPD